MTHRYPTRFQLRKLAEQNKQDKLEQQKLKKEKYEFVYVVNLAKREYFECSRHKAPKMTQELKTPLTKTDALLYTDLGKSRWDKNDRVVFCPKNCMGYVYRTYTCIF